MCNTHTAPPRLEPLPAPFTGEASAAAMPAPRRRAAFRLLPAGLTEEQYLQRFLAAFGARPGRAAVFTDEVGEPIAIVADLSEFQGTVYLSLEFRIVEFLRWCIYLHPPEISSSARKVYCRGTRPGNSCPPSSRVVARWQRL